MLRLLLFISSHLSKKVLANREAGLEENRCQQSWICLSTPQLPGVAPGPAQLAEPRPGAG